MLTVAGVILSASPNQIYSDDTSTVTVTIVDENGEPLPGVNIVIKGTLIGTITDLDGNFTIGVDGPDAILVISIVGYRTQEVTVGNQTQIDVALEIDIIGLEEVVAYGYGTMKKSDLTGAVVSADIAAFQEAPNTNIMQSLQGTVAGLNIGMVDAAGQTPSISIRGNTTISGSKNPLIVVDGIIYHGNISDLNSSDIGKTDY